MGTREWTTVDKAEWGAGPWLAEPDKLQWVDAATDLDCLIVRGPSGALCGYVGLPPGHPCHGAGYDDVACAESENCRPDVHGGLTFAGACAEGDDESVGICHVPGEGRPAEVWWLGFDCAHYMDIGPASLSRSRARGYEDIAEPGARYRTVGYVRRETERLASQLATATAVVRDDGLLMAGPEVPLMPLPSYFNPDDTAGI
jgi:hypothetical protein